MLWHPEQRTSPQRTLAQPQQPVLTRSYTLQWQTTGIYLVPEQSSPQPLRNFGPLTVGPNGQYPRYRVLSCTESKMTRRFAGIARSLNSRPHRGSAQPGPSLLDCTGGTLGSHLASTALHRKLDDQKVCWYRVVPEQSIPLRFCATWALTVGQHRRYPRQPPGGVHLPLGSRLLLHDPWNDIAWKHAALVAQPGNDVHLPSGCSPRKIH